MNERIVISKERQLLFGLALALTPTHGTLTINILLSPSILRSFDPSILRTFDFMVAVPHPRLGIVSRRRRRPLLKTLIHCHICLLLRLFVSWVPYFGSYTSPHSHVH
jgi:hypothetical protein